MNSKQLFPPDPNGEFPPVLGVFSSQPAGSGENSDEEHCMFDRFVSF